MIRTFLRRPVPQPATLVSALTRAKRTVRGPRRPEPAAAPEFPYAHISEAQFDRWTESTQPQPLHAFFAQHRPLLTMAQPLVTQDAPTPAPGLRHAIDARDVMFVPVYQPEHHEPLGEPAYERVPQDIAHELGAFDVAAALRAPAAGPRVHPVAPVPRPRTVAMPSSGSEAGATETARGASAARSRGRAVLARSGQPLQLSDMPESVQDTLHLLGSLLTQHNAGAARAEADHSASGRSGETRPRGTLTHVSIVDGEPVVEFEAGDADIEATSVRRKRKLKMNRHKYRKRLKAQRSLRRRLGK